MNQLLKACYKLVTLLILTFTILALAGNKIVAWQGSDSPISVEIIGLDTSMNWTTVTDVATDSSGNIIVSHLIPHHITKISPTGELIARFGSVSDFYTGVATDSEGNIYALDNNNARVKKFSPTGTLITSWGSSGTGDGQFFQMRGIAVDSLDNIYVGDISQNRVQKFTSDGTFVLKWGSTGSGNSQFQILKTLAVDPNDDVYVLDYYFNNRVIKFNSSGTYISQFGTLGTGDGQFTNASGLDIDSSGNIFVSDNAGRIQKFNSSHTFINSWEVSTLGTETHYFPLATDPSGNILIGFEDTNTPDGYRLKRYSNSGVFIENLGHNPLDDGRFSDPFRIYPHPNGNLYVTDYDSGRIQVLDRDGNFISKFGSKGTGNGQFTFMGGIAFDSLGYIYVVDLEERRVQKFDPEGNYVLQWGSQGTGPGEFEWAYGGIVIDSSDTVFVLDNANSNVQAFDTLGNYLFQWGTFGSGDGELKNPEDIAISSDDEIYVLDLFNSRVQKFTTTGEYISQWGVEGTDDGQFSSPSSIAADRFGNVFVVDYIYPAIDPRIQVFNSDGVFQTSFGSRGWDAGQHFYIIGMGVDSDGYLYTVDESLKRISKYTFDRLPPEVVINPFTDDEVSSNTPTITGTATDLLTPITSVEISINGGLYTSCTANDGTFDELVEEFTCTITNELSQGENTVSIKATDSTTNSTGDNGEDSEEYTFTVVQSDPDPDPDPTVVLPVISSTISVIPGYTSAQIIATISSDGGSTITERGIVYSSSNNNPSINDFRLKISGTTGELLASLINLMPNTTYYFKVYAMNSEGIQYSETKSFTTNPLPIFRTPSPQLEEIIDNIIDQSDNSDNLDEDITDSDSETPENPISRPEVEDSDNKDEGKERGTIAEAIRIFINFVKENSCIITPSILAILIAYLVVRNRKRSVNSTQN